MSSSADMIDSVNDTDLLILANVSCITYLSLIYYYGCTHENSWHENS